MLHDARDLERGNLRRQSCDRRCGLPDATDETAAGDRARIDAAAITVDRAARGRPRPRVRPLRDAAAQDLLLRAHWHAADGRWSRAPVRVLGSECRIEA